MIRNELVKRSPLRILEQSIRGGLGKGNVGVIAAPKGVGKTACLVHIATDQLLEGKHVIHVSFASDTQHIITWYEDIFAAISDRYRLDGAMDVHDDITRNRVIMNFRQDGITAQQVQRSIRSIISDGSFNADVVVIDGYDFTKSNAEEFAGFRKFAQETQIEIWFSASTPRTAPHTRNPEIADMLTEFLPSIDVFISLQSFESFVKFRLVKDHEVEPSTDLHLKLDPHTLLIAEEAESA